ncbi:MAG: hypothetical protein ACK5HL_01490 [Bacilli bacterium]
MKNVYYPLAGMNYVIDDLAKIIENKMAGKKEINLWLSAQVNCYPHIGTLTNFISSFALAKHLQDYYKVPVKIKIELLESVTGEEQVIEGIKYYKNLDRVIVDDGKTIIEKYLPYFIEILDKLKLLDNIDYEIRFFYDYQKDPLVKKSLIEVMNNYELLRYTLDPKDGEIKLRFPCPKCGLTEKHLVKTKFDEINPTMIRMSSFCPEHGETSILIDEKDNERFDMNVPLRYLVKILYLLKKDKEDNSLNVIVDGADWSVMWPLRVYMEPLLRLGYKEVPSIIYSPTILDWSGSKLSKRMYVGNNAYREYLKEGLINYSEFYNQYGDIGFERIYKEINEWILDPKRFIRDYTIEYMDAILNGEEINKLN